MPPDSGRVAGICAGASALGLDLADAQADALLRYLLLLEKWNRHYNLTAVRNIDQMIPRHLLDSLSICEYIAGKSLLDVGSGAGLPGIPIAIVKPHLTVTVLDTVLKKTRFLQFAVNQLGLANVRVAHCRVESMRSPPTFDTIVARAFATPAKFLRLSGHLLAPGGQVLAMMAATDFVCGDRSLAPFDVVGTKKLSVPGDTAERNIVIFAKSDQP